uniref:Uncharacterized protein n=1 Tax=uncultured marine microorganism HF4000_005I08 TaxID=455507 RepID=B3T0H5_9ZZZZ|nr:hypothetical protein ALOHA_HF4000005I08ctg1g11 [uncultured marine microorganism HF4000_005I08]
MPRPLDTQRHPIDLCADGAGRQQQPQPVGQGQQQDEKAEILPHQLAQNIDRPLCRSVRSRCLLGAGILRLVRRPIEAIKYEHEQVVDGTASRRRPAHPHPDIIFRHASVADAECSKEHAVDDPVDEGVVMHTEV